MADKCNKEMDENEVMPRRGEMRKRELVGICVC